MKKRIFAMLLSALLVANISACNFVFKNEIDETFENTDTTGLNFEEADENTTESETSVETEPTRDGWLYCNGLFHHSDPEIAYTVDQNRNLSIHIPDWNEDHLVTSFSDRDLGLFRYTATAIAVNNERAFLLLKRHYEAINKVTVVSFEKGSKSETVTTLDVDGAVYKVGGNFINENIGYLFAFREEIGGHARGSSRLSNLYKTEDGGKTWKSINVQAVPSISLQEHIIFAKMVSEDVGVISGNLFACENNFCERTLLTTDGGVHWATITALSQIDDLLFANITDFALVDGFYILAIRYNASETDYGYAKYQSSDLNTWIRIS